MSDTIRILQDTSKNPYSRALMEVESFMEDKSVSFEAKDDILYIKIKGTSFRLIDINTCKNTGSFPRIFSEERLEFIESS